MNPRLVRYGAPALVVVAALAGAIILTGGRDIREGLRQATSAVDDLRKPAPGLVQWAWAEGQAEESGTFVEGETPIAVFTLPADFSARPVTLSVRVVDEDNQVVSETAYPMTLGEDHRAKVELPHGRLGFYRVFATAGDGARSTTIAPRGTITGPYLSYVVVQNPLDRPALPSGSAFFGMQGGFSRTTLQLAPKLGIRWTNGPFDWGRTEPGFEGELTSPRTSPRLGPENLIRYATYRGRQWPVYPVFSLHARTPDWARKLSEAEANLAFERYVKSVAEIVGRAPPSGLEDHIYQVTWEPDASPDYQGRRGDYQAGKIVELHRIAYRTLHAADPKAVVIGPTSYHLDNLSDPFNTQVLDAGLTRYLDAWSVHVYQSPIRERPSLALLQERIRGLRQQISAAGGSSLGIYSTEHGYAWRGTDYADEELFQALYMVKSNVVLYAEGLKMAMSFYIVDYPDRGNESDEGYARYGFYYNLDKTRTFGPDEAAPKPAAAGFAALTGFLEGSTPAGRPNFGPGLDVYSFLGGRGRVTVLWSRDATQRTATPACDAANGYVRYDWMGNRVGQVRCGDRITVGHEPVYLLESR